jgi:hypothetical protein
MRTGGEKKGEMMWACGKEEDWCAFAFAFASCLAPVVVEVVVSLVLTRGSEADRPEQKWLSASVTESIKHLG